MYVVCPVAHPPTHTCISSNSGCETLKILRRTTTFTSSRAGLGNVLVSPAGSDGDGGGVVDGRVGGVRSGGGVGGGGAGAGEGVAGRKNGQGDAGHKFSKVSALVHLPCKGTTRYIKSTYPVCLAGQAKIGTPLATGHNPQVFPTAAGP